MHVPAEMLVEPEPKDLFEARLFAIARRWWKRDVECISDLCNRMQATREQRQGAVNAYLIERAQRE